jgi:hypothetical protein
MTTKASGTVAMNVPQNTSYTLSSKTTSIQNNNNFSSTARFASAVPVIPPVQVTNGAVTSHPDVAGFIKLPTPQFFTPAQTVAIRSAAINTALAFGLDTALQSDRAALKQRSIADIYKAEQPPVLDDEVIIPP